MQRLHEGVAGKCTRECPRVKEQRRNTQMQDVCYPESGDEDVQRLQEGFAGKCIRECPRVEEQRRNRQMQDVCCL